MKSLIVRNRWLTLSIRQLLGLVLVAALASTLMVRLLQQREFERRGPISEKLLRPLINHHDYLFHSHSQCGPSNMKTALGQLDEAKREFFSGVKQIWFQRRFLFGAHDRQYIRLTAQNSWRNCVSLAKVYRDSARFASSQLIMISYHQHLRDYYQGLRAENAIELPPLPPAILAERQSLQELLRRVTGDTSGVLDPEPLPIFDPKMPKKPVPPQVWVGDSF